MRGLPITFIIIPVALAGLVWGLSPDAPDLMSRVMLAAALGLLAQPALESSAAGAETGETGIASRILNPVRWLFVCTVVAFFVALTALATWTGDAITLDDLRESAVTGLIIGVVTGFLLPRRLPHAARVYDLDRPASGSLLGRFVVYGWPIAATAIIVGVTLDPPEGGWNGIYPLFQMVFLPFLVMYHPHRGNLVRNWPVHAPRILGFILLIAALIVAA
ncbi:hypothetical protein [Pseudaestuariivita atlantica]|uniref:Uncharacterized protein n=1 Tax=Pseudaestuariivita atlantica TaxID=1317121 RepID=A0A0L1JU12_9RHOB|nr:hypothetical protein [Pseudaestuariivita atlantica]KNG95264.1 hypothetical protein ATO11_01105 [Pseudaestuariivita atlantica]